jgi:DNA-binding response OmpR family regulator
VGSLAILQEEWAKHRRRLELESRVLVVEDDEAARQELENLLFRQHISARTVAKPETAMEMLASKSYSVAMVSEGLTGLGGLYLVRQIRMQHPAVDAIVYGTEASPDLITKAFDLHLLDVLPRPLPDLEAFGQAMRDALRRNVERRMRMHVLTALRANLERLASDERLRTTRALERRLSAFKNSLGPFIRVLVVEQEESDLRLLSELLLLAGLHVETAADLDAALAQATTGVVHLLAVNVELAAARLAEVMARLQRDSPLCELMLVSRNPSIEQVRAALAAGVAAYLAWPPLSHDVVVRRVQEVLRRSRRDRLMDNLLAELFQETNRGMGATDTDAAFERFRELIGLQRVLTTPEMPTERAGAVAAVDYLDSVLDSLLSPDEELVITYEVPAVGSGLAEAGEGSERRAHFRVLESQFIRYRPKPAVASTLALLGDLSEGGLFIRTAELLLPGTLVEVDFNVDLEGQGYLIRCRAQVAWVARDNKQSPLGPGFGVKFLDTPPDVLALLQRIVAVRLKAEGGSTPAS